jgi:hypothetical protein
MRASSSGDGRVAVDWVSVAVMTLSWVGSIRFA